MEIEEYHRRINACFAAAHGRSLKEQLTYEALLNGGEAPAERTAYKQWVDRELRRHWAERDGNAEYTVGSMLTQRDAAKTVKRVELPADDITMGEHFRIVIDWFEREFPPLPEKEE